MLKHEYGRYMLVVNMIDSIFTSFLNSLIRPPGDWRSAQKAKS